MKRRVMFIVPVVLLTMVVALFGLATVAFADNGPHVASGLTTTTDACAGCHRTHTGTGSKLLKASDSKALCFTCHSGTGAETNVVDGVVVTGGTGLRGGGFTNAKMDPTVSGTPASAAVTSSHSVDAVSDMAWGGGAISGTANYGTSMTLTCINCHNPHGNGQYRILKHQPVNGYGTTDVTVADESTKVYGISYTLAKYRDITYEPATMNTWCGQCHSRYVTGAGSAQADSGDAVYHYRHTTNASGVNCLSCHVVHGSSSVMTGYSASFTAPDATTPTDTGRLLTVNNRGVCVQCHTTSLTGN